jgi:beta-alanine degradation protein BauB
MRILKTVLACAALIAAASGARAADTGASVNLPVTKLKFFETGIGPLQAAPAFGNLKTGPHGTYIKMPAGFVSPAHTHTGDYYGIVISGVGANGVPGSADVELPAGSYWFQKGKEAHVTKCLSATECIFFISQLGPFDDIPAK